MSDPPEGDESQHIEQVLIASVHDLRHFTALLRGINFSNRATVIIADTGLVVSVEEARTLLGTAFINEDLFDEFIYTPPPDNDAPPSQRSSPMLTGPEPPKPIHIALEIPLGTLVECLNIFGAGSASNTSSNASSRASKFHRQRRDHEEGDGDGGADKGVDHYFGSEKATGMRLSYRGPGHPLVLLISNEAGGPTATCEITTFEPEPQLQLDFGADDAILITIFKSSWLRDALSELDPSCEKLTIIANPPPPAGRAARASAPRLRLRAAGTFGTTEMDYPSDKEVLESCVCDEPLSFSYNFRHIMRSLKALQSSTKTSLRISDEGLLSFQLLMPYPKPGNPSAHAFIEFRCLPLEEAS